MARRDKNNHFLRLSSRRLCEVLAFFYRPWRDKWDNKGRLLRISARPVCDQPRPTVSNDLSRETPAQFFTGFLVISTCYKCRYTNHRWIVRNVSSMARSSILLSSPPWQFAPKRCKLDIVLPKAVWPSLLRVNFFSPCMVLSQETSDSLTGRTD